MKDKITKDTETTVAVNRMDNIETWIDQAAPKLDIEFKY